MARILLICAGGMSTSMLVSKMKKAAESQGVTVDINATGEAALSQYVDKVDVVLLGPQIRFLHEKVKSILEPKGIPSDVINSMDYGAMNGEKVLKTALDLLKK